MTTGHFYGAIWDMDGVLVDSGDLHYQTWQAAIRDAYGIEIDRTAFIATFGRGNPETIRMLAGHAPTPEVVERVAGAKERAYRDLAPQHVRALPGAVELVKALQEAGWRQAVGTSAPRENLDLMLDLLQIRPYLHAWISADDVAISKPDPATFLLAVERMQVEPGRCVVIEDSPAGIEAARRGGMRAVGLTTTHPAAALDGADWIIGSLLEVTSEWLLGLFAGN